MVSHQAKGFFVGFSTGLMGGLVGLGGAEFRLPMLLKFFSFNTLQAIILNKFMSLITVAFSIIFRFGAIDFRAILSNIHIVFMFLTGSVIGAWFAADWATKAEHSTLNKVIAVIMVIIAMLMFFRAYLEGFHFSFDGLSLVLITIIVGFMIGIASAILGVAGGELYIPSITMLYNTTVKLSGSLSLLISFPTMIVAFFRYSRDSNFSVIKENINLTGWMIFGTVVGSFTGGYLLLGLVDEKLIIYSLVLLLLFSAYKVWKH